LWQDINQRVEDLSSYIICFGFARGCLRDGLLKT
jgi:hypothetical protein